jgi:hypothetical protein
LGDEGLGLVGERVVEMDFGHEGGGQLMALVDGGIFRRERNDDCIRGWEENKQPEGELQFSLDRKSLEVASRPEKRRTRRTT